MHPGFERSFSTIGLWRWCPIADASAFRLRLEARSRRTTSLVPFPLCIEDMHVLELGRTSIGFSAATELTSDLQRAI
jgi:hypothetical protein